MRALSSLLGTAALVVALAGGCTAPRQSTDSRSTESPSAAASPPHAVEAAPPADAGAGVADAARSAESELDSARAVLAAFEDAANRHDRAALAELFDRDVVWFQGQEPVYVGRQAVLDSMAYDATTNVSIRLVPLELRGGRVHCEIHEQNDLFRALGLEGLGHVVEVEIADGHVRTLVSHPPDPESIASRTIQDFLAWFTEENASEAVSILYAPGSSPERARRLVQYAEAWVAAGRP